MSLHDLRREYEDRRRALIEQLNSNKTLDAAAQHQVYGAIKEIEHFLATIDAHQEAQQARGLNVELSRERPRPFVERTQKVFHKVRTGTGRVFKERIPRVSRALVAAPKRYFDRKREERRLRREIEAEVRARQATQGGAAANDEFVVLEHPHQVLHAEESTPQSYPLEEIVQQPVVPEAPAPRVTRKGAPLGAHPKRRKAIETPAKKKTQHGKNSAGKKGGQHKPHQKRGKQYFAPSKKKRR